MFKKLLLGLLAFFAAAMVYAAVDINKASKAELESIKGIGPVIADRILEERKKGPFKDWADLDARVKGIGEGMTAKISAGGGTIDGKSFAGAAPKPEAKKDEPKKDAPKAEAKKDEPKKDAPKAEAKKDEPKKDAPKAEAKKDEPKKDAPKAEAKKDEPKKDAPKAEAKKDEPKKDAKPAAAAASAASAAKK